MQWSRNLVGGGGGRGSQEATGPQNFNRGVLLSLPPTHGIVYILIVPFNVRRILGYTHFIKTTFIVFPSRTLPQQDYSYCTTV